MSMTIESLEVRGRSLIGYSESSDGSETIHAIDPSNNAPLDPPFLCATSSETDRAAQLAHQAFLVYSRLSGEKKAAFLEAIASKIESLGDALVERATQETGLPEARIKGETARTTGQLRLFATLVKEGSWVEARIDRADPDRQPLPKPDTRAMARPLGPVVVFAASNFPLAFSAGGGDTAAALAAGCPVIVKAHHSHPGTSELVGRAIITAAQETGMPEGVYSMLFGSGRSVGAALVAHPLVKAVGFTGSTSGGKALMKIAAERPEPIPVYAEMGSINPVFILPGALKERAEKIAAGLHGSATLGVGQFCTNPGLVLLDRSKEADQMMEAFVDAMQNTEAQVMLNAGISQSYREGVDERSKQPEVEALVAHGTDQSEGCLGSTAVFQTSAKRFLEDESLSSEIFGPGTTVLRAHSPDELLRVAERIEGQLTATIHATEEDLKEHGELIAALERKVGRLVFNGFPTGVEVCHSMVHGGPFPATSDGRSTSVGTLSIYRFTRHVCFQDCPDAILPPELQEANPLAIHRMEDGQRVQPKR